MSSMKEQQTKQKKRPKAAGGDSPAKRAKKSAQEHKKHEHVQKTAPKLLTKKEQKEAVKSKKLKFKKNYVTIQETVLLWEQLRPKQTTKEQKALLVSTILKKLKGNIPELANHHSASRVIQWCLKEGSAADKERLTSEIKSNIVEISKSKHGRFVVQKLINIASKEEVPGLVKLYKGRVAELLRNTAGADVLDDLYSVSPQSCRNVMCAELYGREFTLFEGVGTHSEDISTLDQLLGSVDAGRRQAVVQHLYRGLAPVLEKALLHPVMTHRLLRELLSEAPGSIVADVVDTLAATGGNALKLVHTHDGAAAAAMALVYGTPKDRKRLVKGMKGYVWQTAENEWGHAVVATALSVVDDTSLVSKTILGELKDHLQELCTNKHAHRVLMQLLAPDSQRYLPPATLAMIHPPAKTMMVAADSAGGAAAAGALGLDDDEILEDHQLQEDVDAAAAGHHGGAEHADDDAVEDDAGQDAADAAAVGGRGAAVEASAAAAAAGDGGSGVGGAENGSEPPKMVARQLGESKKAATARRRELLGSGPGSFSAALLSVCGEEAVQLLQTPAGADVLVEVARGGAGGLLWQLQPAAVESVHQTLVQHIAQGCSSAAPAAEPPRQQQRKAGKQASVAADSTTEVDQQRENLLTNYFSSRALRRLLLAGSESGEDGAGGRAFAQELWFKALQGQCQQLVGSHADKVLAAFLHCGVDSVMQAATAELQPLVEGNVEAWAQQFMGPGRGQATAVGGSKSKRKKHDAITGKKQQQQQHEPPEQQAGKQQQQPVKKGRKKSYQAFKG